MKSPIPVICEVLHGHLAPSGGQILEEIPSSLTTIKLPWSVLGYLLKSSSVVLPLVHVPSLQELVRQWIDEGRPVTTLLPVTTNE